MGFRRYSGLLADFWALICLVLWALGIFRHGVEALYSLPGVLLNLAPLCGAFLIAERFARARSVWLVVALGMTAAFAMGGHTYWDFNFGPNSRNEPMLARLYAPFVVPALQILILAGALPAAWFVERRARTRTTGA